MNYSQHILCQKSDQNISFPTLFWPRIGYVFQGTYFSETLKFLSHLFFLNVSPASKMYTTQHARHCACHIVCVHVCLAGGGDIQEK